MIARVAAVLCALTLLADADPAVSFQSHYIRLGDQDSSVAIAADAAGNIFIVSQMVDSAHNSSVRVTKTDSQGNVVAEMDFAPGVTPSGAAIDPQGNLLVVGGRMVAKLDNNLTTLFASTTLAGGANAVTTDAVGNVYVTGPVTTQGVPASPTYGFVAMLSPDLSTIVHQTQFGGATADCSPTSDSCRFFAPGQAAQTIPNSIALDSNGAVIVAGNTDSTPAQLLPAPYMYGFAAKFSPDLSSLQAKVVLNTTPDSQAIFAALGTPAGSTGENRFRGMAVDAQGNVILAGDGQFSASQSPAGTLQPLPPRGQDIFVVKLDNNFNYIWGTFFGSGSNAHIAVDSAGDVWISGNAQISTLPNSNSTSIAYSPFVAELTPDGTSIMNMASSQFGGGAITLRPGGGAAILGTDSFLLTAPPDQPSLLMVANSANNQSSGSIAPIELLSLYGTGIGPDPAGGGEVVDSAFTTSIAGYQVLFNGIPAPLLYAGPNQINLVSPGGIADQQTATIEVVGPSSTTIFPTVFVNAVKPQIFSQQLPYTPLGAVQPFLGTFAIAYNEDGTLNSQSHPAPAGSVVTIWATGTGLTSNLLADGAIASSGSALNVPVAIPSVEIPYAGQAPDAVQGLTQINFRVPSDRLGNQLGISFQQGGYSTATALIWISNN